jgi:hypothetical protein
LSIAAAILAAAVVPVSFLAPLYSSGRTISDTAGGLFLVALAVGVVLAIIPLVVPGSVRQATCWVCGALLVLTSFITVLGMFFIPSGIILMVCGYLSGRKPSSVGSQAHGDHR